MVNWCRLGLARVRGVCVGYLGASCPWTHPWPGLSLASTQRKRSPGGIATRLVLCCGVAFFFKKKQAFIVLSSTPLSPLHG